MKAIYIMLVALLFSCGSTKIQTIEKVVYKDSIVYELKDTTIYKHIEKEVVKNVLKDTDTSLLENTFAYSTAFVTDGFLYHNLEQKEQDLPYRVFYFNKYHFSTRDSLVYRTNIEYIKRDLTKWQTIQIWMGRFLLIGLGLFVYRKFRFW